MGRNRRPKPADPSEVRSLDQDPAVGFQEEKGEKTATFSAQHHMRRAGDRAGHRALISSLYREWCPAQNTLSPQRLLPVLCDW